MTDFSKTAESLVLYEKDVDHKIAYITLNRPDNFNAATTAMRIRYAEILNKANIDDEVKVVVIRGAGDHFGSGADLPEQADFLSEAGAAPPLEEFGIDDPDVKYPPQGSFRHLLGLTELYAKARGGCRSLQEFKKISIVEAKGYCYGWHFYQAGDADLLIASEDTLFGHPAFRYAGWGPRLWTWAETMGMRKFQEMLFTGRPFTAKEMAQCNFVNSVVPRENLEKEVEKYALACSRTRPTDTVVVQKTFFEMMKQQRGEYFGSLLTALVESLGPYMQAGPDDLVLNRETFDKGLNQVVKDFEAQYPPEWRMSLSGRKRP